MKAHFAPTFLKNFRTYKRVCTVFVVCATLTAIFLALSVLSAPAPNGGATSGATNPAALTIQRGASPHANLVVTKTADTNDGLCDADCSLREALATADIDVNDPDTITFNIPGPGPDVITLGLDGQLFISGNTTINGPTSKSLTVDGNNTTRVFRVDGDTVNISNITVAHGFEFGQVVGGGSGVLVSGGSVTTLTNMLFTGNTAIGGNGGALSISEGGQLNVRNSTFSGNAARNGGAIANGGDLGGGQVDLLNVTITNNTADGNIGGCAGGQGLGGGLYASPAGFPDPIVRNSIIANNTSCVAGSENVSGAFTDRGNNITSGDPLVGPLQDNGGPTFTRALLTGSPAIDTGNDCVVTDTCTPAYGFFLTTDQRGSSRRQDGDGNGAATTDIGAYEFIFPDLIFNTSGSLAAGIYHNVTINNCGTFVNLTGNVTITGTLTVNTCAHLQTDSFIVSGGGSFVLTAGGWLHIGDANGITPSPTLAGSIQVTGTRSYSTAGNYVYTGSVNQAVGLGLPGTVANLLISNTGGAGNKTVTGNPLQVVTALLEVVSGVYSSASDYNDVQIDVNGTLSLTGDITVSGNWTSANGTFTPNGFRVTFDGAGTQIVTRPIGETFARVTINKASGSVQMPGAVNINAASGNVLELLGGTLDMTGSLNFLNAGGNVLVSGGVRNIISSLTGSVSFLAAKTVTSSAGGTLVFDTNITVFVQAPVDFGANVSTVNSLLVLSGGLAAVNTNAPTYGASSALQYDNLSGTSRGAEWTSTTGSTFPSPGFPNNVIVGINTILSVGTAGGTTTNWAINGSLAISNTGTFSLAGGSPMTVPVTIKGSVVIVNGGSLVLSSAAGGDLKTMGNFGRFSGGVFTANNRALWFEGGSDQVINDFDGSAVIPHVVINKTANTVILNGTDLTTLGTSSGDSIKFLTAASTLRLDGHTLTLGATVPNAPAGAGLLTDPSANLILNDGGTTGDMGTIPFSGAASLNNLTVNRTTAAGNVTLGSSVSVGSALTLTAGTVNLGANTLSLTNAATASRTSGYVIGNLQKSFSATGAFTFPVGTANGYSPVDANVTAANGNNLSVKAVQGAQPNYAGTNKLARYWTLSGSITADLTFHYLAADVVGTEGNYKIFRYNGSFTQFTPDVLNTTLHFATLNNVSSFSDWTLAEPTGAATATISGHLNYADGVTPGKNVTMTLTGAGGFVPQMTTTNANGDYSFVNIPTGNDYTLTPSKIGDVNGIESFDAAKVARFVAGLDIATANQRLAADADDDTILTSLDAALIARRVAGLPGFGIVGSWKFSPANRTYPVLNADQTSQNFAAILVGDTSGNWLPALPNGEGRKQ